MRNIVYHYTSPNGILDILQSKKLRFTDCQYLNDKSEFIYSLINKLKLFFKNPAFSSEEEYRFILAVENDFSESSDLALQFRVGKSGIITPFIEWNYTTHKKPEKLFSQITLAPMIEPELAEESFKRLLGNTSLKKIPIKQSSIKLRF